MSTITDTGTSPNPPSGAVTFTSNGVGTFSPASCTLSVTGAATASCSITYTPITIGTGIQTIAAPYSGDSTHTASSGTATLTINRRSTATTVNCIPSTVTLGQTTTCTATVTDTAPGTGFTPT